jgi:hypothetical protein
MTRTMTRRAAALILLTALSVPTFAAPAAFSPAAPAPRQEGLEKAQTSKILSLRLPDAAFRSTNEQMNAQFVDALKKAAAGSKGRLAKTETLIWQSGSDARKKLPEILKAAGYEYMAQPTQKVEGAGEITMFGAAKKGEKRLVFGIWMESEQASLLTWGVVISEGGAGGADDAPTAPTETPSSAPDSDAPRPLFGDDAPAPKGGKAPASLVGAWQFVNIPNAKSGGMAVQLSLSPDGKYQYLLLRRKANADSSLTETVSIHEGTVTFQGDGDRGSLTVHPVRGQYRMNDPATGTKTDRPYEKHEMQTMTFHYEWRKDAEGKRQLFLGPSKDSMSPFKKG